MALIWQHSVDGTKYEVRNAGSSVRLYTNGVFHTQYSPRHLFTGAVWDLLTLPILFNSDHADRVLMLGVGGGSGIHQLNRLVSPREIVGVELIDIHLEIARRFFDIDYDNVTLYQDDAERWLENDESRFDAVIDDVFVDGDNDPYRPIETNHRWYSLLNAHVADEGVLIQNHISPSAARQQMAINESLLRSFYSSAILFTVPNFENCIVALYRKPVNARSARARVMARLREIARGETRKLRFSCSQLFIDD
ncbi:MAG: hypothetical protein HUJ31_10025 [Pseudomonadales bacterium]|nr:hypothetical protein [Pseudomonadales bacterium]